MPDENIFNNRSKPLILDGSMGSLLQQMGKTNNSPVWSGEANFTAPDTVEKIHRQYIAAGADIITTNTFRTNPLALIRSGASVSPGLIVKKACSLAHRAAEGQTTLIAGSNPPAEDCYQRQRNATLSELEDNHQRHIGSLIENNCDFILHETQSHLDEIKIILKIMDGNKFPFIISLYITPELTLLDGSDIQEALDLISQFNPRAVSFNCCPVNDIIKIVSKMNISLSFGFYANMGGGNVHDNEIYCGTSPDIYIAEIETLIRFNPSFLGACCGSSFEHIRKLRIFIDEFYSD